MNHGPLIVESRPVGPFAMNSYLVGCATTRQAAIVDSGGDVDEMLALAARHELHVGKLLQTHAHIDHVAGLAEMKRRTAAPIYLHPLDAPIYDNVATFGRFFGIRVEPLPPVDLPLAEGDVIEVGALRLNVLHTPGHAPGHVCFHLPDVAVVFGGDLIFRGSIGRVDLPGCDPQAMKRSLDRVAALWPNETTIYPGHMEPTTMGHEKHDNPFLGGGW